MLPVSRVSVDPPAEICVHLHKCICTYANSILATAVWVRCRKYVLMELISNYTGSPQQRNTQLCIRWNTCCALVQADNVPWIIVCHTLKFSIVRRKREVHGPRHSA